MSKSDKKRLHIFDKFATNLTLVRSNEGMGERTDEVNGDYICPICVVGHSKESLNQNSENPLTLEDVPPKSLGGTQIALTCKICNNGLGCEIDWHLAERLKELEFKDKKPKSEKLGEVEFEGVVVNGKMQVDSKGNIQMMYSKKNNNPLKLEAVVGNINKGSKLNFSSIKSRVDAKKLQIALLKNAYLLVFEKFGYAFLLNKEYERVRRQLLNPNDNIYPLNCWFQAPFPKEHFGVSFITEKGLESIFVLFELKTNLTSRVFGVILPLVNNEIEDVITEIHNRFEKNGSFSVEMQKYSDNYLENVESISKMLNWMISLNRS